MEYCFLVKKVVINNNLLYDTTEVKIPVKGVSVIVGSNGCGKTTLLNHIIYSNPEQIVLIAQENDLIFNNMSIEDNIMLLNKNYKKLDALLRMFEMEYILERNPKHLSGGEKRIISLLRMFFVDKDIVFLDEPTNDLDYRTVEKVKTIITQLANQKSLLIVTHDQRISSIADKIYSFRDGVLLADDNDEKGEVRKIVKKSPSKSIGRLVKRDVVGNLLFLLLIISIVSSSFFLIVTNKKNIEYIKPEQTNMCSKYYAGIDVLIKNGYIPIQAYKNYNGKIDADFIKSYYESIEIAKNQGGTLNMFLEKTLGEEVYLSIFFDAITSKQINLMKEYQLLRKIQLGKEVDFTNYISSYDGVSEIVINHRNGVEEQIDSSIYYVMEEIYTENYEDYQPVLYVVVGINEDEVKKIEGNFFLKNNTTVEICNSINRMETFFSMLVFLCIGLLGNFLFYFLYTNITIKIYRKLIVVLRNLGVSQESVEKNMFEKKCTPIIKFIITIIGVLSCISAMLMCNEYILVMTLIAILTFWVGICTICISRKMIVSNIKKIYSFGGIYEN